jgi:hypothetical protein
MNTIGAIYGRCSGCSELKHVTADATVADHNGYDTEGTSVAVVRCPGSGRPPVDAQDEVNPAWVQSG